MTTLMFQPQFADAVSSGAKRQTIRPPRKRPIEVGQRLSLRKWQGSAYRSRQIELRAASCVEVCEIEIMEHAIVIEGDGEHQPGLHAFAVADGFQSWGHMRDWFKATHGLPFRGVLIKWQVTDDE